MSQTTSPLPVQPKAAPAQPPAVPAQPSAALAQAQAAPAKAEPVHVAPVQAPVAHPIPAQAKVAPAKTDVVPAEAKVLPPTQPGVVPVPSPLMVPVTPTVSVAKPEGRFGFARLKRVNQMFLWVVALPTLLSIAYFGLIASDIYVSESRFVMRSPQKPAMTGLGAILQSAGFARSQDDTYTVHDYMLSRDALGKLDEEFSLREAFGDERIDRLNRFGGLDGDISFEALHKYYSNQVTVEPDALSSISTLEVSAFTAEDAYRINERLLQLSEELVNQLNERGRQDMIRFAAAEVETAEAKAKAATLAVSAFRSEKAVFDPERQSALQLQLVSKLQDELISTKTQLAQVRSLTRDNPLIPTLQNRLSTLQAAINSETAKIAGGERSLSKQSADFERLALESGFADKQLGVALASLEQARNDAQRKQLYLERIVHPSKPDVAVQPRRLRGVLATLVLSLAAWGILTMLVAGIREHRD